jgi:hypothetical protein
MSVTGAIILDGVRGSLFETNYIPIWREKPKPPFTAISYCLLVSIAKRWANG